MDAQQVASLFRSRSNDLSERHSRMQQVSDVYYGRVGLPLPELSRDEEAAVPNLCKQGADGLAQRIASVMPNQIWPALRPGIKTSEAKADGRRQIAYGWLEHSHAKKLFARRARWMITYASAPVVIRPDASYSGPCWEPTSPFDVFPAKKALDSYTPEDVLIRHKRPLRWIQERYPEAAAALTKPRNCTPDHMFTVLEYIDSEIIHFSALGEANIDPYFSETVKPNAVDLTTVPNRAGICWAVTPEQVALDAPAGQFDGILGMYATQAAMMALQVIATRRGIWPHTWLVNPNGGAVPHISQQPDPETGTPGIVTNGIIDRQQLDPSFRAQDVIDRLEYSMRQTAGLPAEMGGSGSQNVRTGRRGAQVMSATIDYKIAEVQDALAESLHEENVRAIAIDKGYFNFSKSMYVSTKGVRGKVDYKPSDVFEDGAEHIVEYSMAGTDLEQLVITGGQRLGMNTMSRRSFMELDPMVSDAEAEDQRVRFESLENSFLVSIQTLASQPDGPMQLPDLIRLGQKMLAQGKLWYEAAAELQEEKQKEQAQGAPQGAPETMPGMAMPGQGAEVPSIGEPTQSMSNLTEMLGQLGATDTALAMRK